MEGTQSREEGHASGSDQQPDDDEHDAVQHGTAHDGDDAHNDQDDGDEPRMNSMPGGTRAVLRKLTYQSRLPSRGRAVGIEDAFHRGDHAPRHFGHGTVAVDRDETAVPIEPLEQWSRLVLEDVEPARITSASSSVRHARTVPQCSHNPLR